MIGAIVLAAGASSRMGRPKALLQIGGRTFLESCLLTLDACGVGCVRVVLGHDAETIRGRVFLADDQVVVNPRPEDGMLSSVRCGLRSLPREVEAFYVWPVDHAGATSSTLGSLLGAWRASGASLAVPLHEGHRGHPVLFSAALREEILAADDGTGLRGVVHAHAADRIVVAVSDPGAIEDADTPEEYARLAARIG